MAPGFYDGSIPEAIATAQRASKLFLVYISDGSEESSRLEEIWNSSRVLSIISEKLVALRLLHGSTDAVNFSALYPYSKAPSITLVGLGAKVWQHEGYISADELAERLQQAVEAYRMQAAARILASVFGMPAPPGPSQASSSRAPEPRNEPRNEPSSSSGISRQATEASDHRTEPVVSTEATVLPTLAAANDRGTEVLSSEVTPPMQLVEQVKEDTDNVQEVTTPMEQIDADRTEDANVQDVGITANPDRTEAEDASIQEVGVPSTMQQEQATVKLDEVADSNDTSIAPHTPEVQISASPTETTEEVKQCVCEVSTLKEATENEKPKTEEKKKPTQIFLQIRMMDSRLVRGEFEPSDSLWAVKALVEADDATLAKMNYRFATPFPRKVFTAEDYDKSLEELDIGYRAALMVVATNDTKPLVKKAKLGPPATGAGYVGRWLSYLNPLSYLRGGAEASTPDANAAGPSSPPGPNAAGPSSPPGSRKGSNATEKNAKWGSNVHTLKHDEEEDPRKRGNSYWNGNSTQFSGEDNDNKR